MEIKTGRAIIHGFFDRRTNSQFLKKFQIFYFFRSDSISRPTTLQAETIPPGHAGRAGQTLINFFNVEIQIMLWWSGLVVSSPPAT
jgi:hypothetical protein